MKERPCEHNGCNKNADVQCCVPELDNTGINVIEYLCEEHAYESGYCTLCGSFWGGIESFDFNNPSHICENCQEQIQDEDFDSYEDIEDWQDGWL